MNKVEFHIRGMSLGAAVSDDNNQFYLGIRFSLARAVSASIEG
jgi:hypothetical protein